MKGIDDPTLAKTERGVSQSSSSLSYDGTGGRSSFARAQSARIAALFGCCSQLRLCSFSITPCHGQSLFVHAIYERINGRPIDIETSGIGRRCSNTRGLPATDRPLRSSAVPVTDSGSTRSCVVIFASVRAASALSRSHTTFRGHTMATMHTMSGPFIQELTTTAATGADMRVVTVSCTRRCTLYRSSWQLVSVSGFCFDLIQFKNNFIFGNHILYSAVPVRLQHARYDVI